MTPPPLSDFYRREQRPLLGYLRGCFPTLDHEELFDAVHDAMTVLLAKPALTQRAWDCGGPRALYMLARRICWRQARDRWRKRRVRRRYILPTHRRDTPPHQERQLQLRHDLDAAIDEAVTATGHGRADALRNALTDKFTSMDSDTVIAKRHDLPREYLSKARGHVRRALLDA